MKTTFYHLLPLITAFFCIGCSAQQSGNNSDTWNNAKWIVYEQLPDAMKIFPGVHGQGDELGEKGKKRSTVPMFRKEFDVNGCIKNATINISGLGHYELYINGNGVGDRFLSPGWTNYQKRELYNTYDLTEWFTEGNNTIGVMVGNGFYNINRERYRKIVMVYGYPKLIFDLKITYENGSVRHIVSDGTCKVTPSPIVFSSIYGGEDYDARQERSGWSISGFDDSKWNNAIELDDIKDKLVLEKDYPIKVMQTFETDRVFKSKTGKTIYDFGQNASGIISLKVKGNKGARIKILPGELLDENKNITQGSSGGPYEFNYFLKGEGIETWQPRFTYYGFRYAEVEVIEPTDTNIKTEVLELKLLHTRNSAPTVGSFQSSDTLFNKIFELINWGIRSNLASVTTDCPHREKLGWLEVPHLLGPSIHYNYNAYPLYIKIVDDMIDSQLENGLVPDIAPEYVPFVDGFRDSPEWGSASVIIPWQLYRWYGDKEILKKAYPMMVRYVNYLHKKEKDHLLNYGLGDWYDLGPKHPGEAQLTPKAVTATAIYYHDLVIISQIAQLLNHEAESNTFMNWSKSVKKAFQKKFYNPETGVCSTGSQTSYAMSLVTGLIPEKDQERVFQNLVKAIKENDYTLTAGDIGYHFLIRILSENGRSDILYRMNNRTDRPGYGYQLRQGATSLTESWAALPSASNNHMMLGHLMEWFYSGLGGIYQAHNSISYDNIIIAPQPVGEIKWVNCSFDSPKGRILSEWNVSGNTFSLKIEIPENTSAKIVIPRTYKGGAIEIINSENQKPLDIGIADGSFTVKPGKYKVVARR